MKTVEMTLGTIKREVNEDELRNIQRIILWEDRREGDPIRFSINDLRLLDSVLSYVITKCMKERICAK